MATQGIVSITHNGKVVMKFIVGCNGMNAASLVKVLKKDGKIPKSLWDAYILAKRVGFGCPRCLVVMNKSRREFYGSEKRLDRLYRKTFNQPRFNPRWKHGIADHVKVIEL